MDNNESIMPVEIITDIPMFWVLNSFMVLFLLSLRKIH